MSNFSEITYNSKQVVCLEPRLILNPLLPELVAKYRCYVIRGNVYHTKRYHVHYFCFDYRPFSIRRNNITVDDIATSFVLDESTGETFPIYIQVPCNHCDVCKSRKINSFVQRCKLETLSYDCKPWFVTLTYDTEHLPVCGLQKTDLQKFLKRFRINLERAGYSFKLRYVAVGEYGKRTHRAHYHLIIWNVDVYKHSDYLAISNILDKSWSLGFTQHRIVNPENDSAFYYTSKYLKKDCVVPKGCNPTFLVSSNGHGGIGSRFLDKISFELRRTLNTNFKYLNKWSQKLEDLVFSQYVLNRIFPSFHKSVPSALRRDLHEFSLDYSIFEKYCQDSLFYEYFKTKFNEFKDKFSNHTFFGRVLFFELPSDRRPALSCLEEDLQTLADRITPWLSLDLKKAEEIQEKRDLFVSRLFQFANPVDLIDRAYKFRSRTCFTSNFEVL